MPKTVGGLTLFDIKELSQEIGITEVTLRKYLRKGKIRGKKIGTKWFVTEEALKEFFEEDKG
jgi:excisionase family DNA binding protein